MQDAPPPPAPARPPAKRGPGRPPKREPPPPAEYQGIADAPLGDKNVLELIHDNPMPFHGLFTYLRAIRAPSVHMLFKPDGLRIFARSQSRRSRVVARIDGAQLSRYYCLGRYLFNFDREDIEGPFASIDSSLHRIVITHGTDNPGAINFRFRNLPLGKTADYEFSIANIGCDEDLLRAEEETEAGAVDAYEFSWKLDPKDFKKMLTDNARFSDDLNIQYVDGGALEVSCAQAGRLSYTETYEKGDAIAACSRLPVGRPLVCSARLSDLRPVSQMASGDVHIHCRSPGQVLLVSDLGYVRVFTLTGATE